jgi:hypothetical protein
MPVRAKFVVNTITRQKHWDKSKGEVQTIKMFPVTTGGEENQKFYEATPSGSLELGVLNEDAAKFFELGKEYYLTFDKAEPAEK